MTNLKVNSIKVNMSSLKDKKLFLLGILKTHTTHVYKLNEFLKMPGNGISIGKSNAYKILARLQEEGLVSSHEERSNNRPPRIVYEITADGAVEFERLLYERLAEHDPGEIPDAVSLNFIGLLKPEESLNLLEKRQMRLASRCESLKDFSDDICATHPGLDLIKQQVHLELRFIQNLILKLKSRIKEKK